MILKRIDSGQRVTLFPEMHGLVQWKRLNPRVSSILHQKLSRRKSGLTEVKLPAANCGASARRRVNQSQMGLPQTVFPDGHFSYFELLDLAQRGHWKFFDKFDKPREVGLWKFRPAML